MKSRLRELLELSPLLFVLALRIYRWKHWSKDWVVTPAHDLVIEGFPRSANSFASIAFDKANKGKLRIATHTHSPAQVIQAVKWQIPVMVLIRNPVDAVTGYLAIEQQLATRENRPVPKLGDNDVKAAAQRWLRFYRSLQPFREKLFLAEFDDVVSNFNAVCNRFIDFTRSNFMAYNPKLVPEEDILAESFHIGPDSEREQIKNAISARINTLAEKGAFAEAEALYTVMGKD